MMRVLVTWLFVRLTPNDQHALFLAYAREHNYDTKKRPARLYAVPSGCRINVGLPPQWRKQLDKAIDEGGR
jgi:hypothetical protein